jgi:hypothetical protein
MDEDKVRPCRAERFQPGVNRGLPRRPAPNRGQVLEPDGRGAKRHRVLRMYHGLHGVDPRMLKKSRQGRADHGFPGNPPILLWKVAADALATSGRNNDSRNSARHVAPLLALAAFALAHVCRRCDMA